MKNFKSAIITGASIALFVLILDPFFLKNQQFLVQESIIQSMYLLFTLIIICSGLFLIFSFPANFIITKVLSGLNLSRKNSNYLSLLLHMFVYITILYILFKSLYTVNIFKQDNIISYLFLIYPPILYWGLNLYFEKNK